MVKKGKIKSFKVDKGFGFIRYSDEDIFFHISDVLQNDRERIAEGAEVEFIIGKAKKIGLLLNR